MGGRIGDKVVIKRGAVGQQIFEQVEQLTANGAMNRLTAFKQIAEGSGRTPGTVAANFYRVARLKGAPLQPRRRGRPAGTGRNRAARITAALDLIGSTLRAQEQELAKLRAQSVAFEKLRRLLRG